MSGVSRETIGTYCQMLRERVVAKYATTSPRHEFVGEVQIDESQFVRRECQRCGVPNDQWIFGICDPE
jgi:hypothetical protein